MVANVIKELLRASYLKNKVYLKDTVLLIIYDFFTFLIQVLFFKIIFLNVLKIEGWEFEDILFLLATSQIIEILYYTFFFGGFASINDWVIEGKFDYFLLLPNYRKLYMFLHEVDVKKCFGLIFPFFLLCKFGPFGSISDIVVYLFLLSIGLFTRFSFGYFIASLVLIFTKVEAIQSVEMELFAYSNFPYVIYQGIWKWVFLFVVPVGVIANAPVSFFKVHTYKIFAIAFLAGVTFYMLATMVFKVFLKRYQSAGG